MKCYAQRFRACTKPRSSSLQIDLAAAKEHHKKFVELGDQYAESHFYRTIQGALDRINNTLEQGEKESK